MNQGSWIISIARLIFGCMSFSRCSYWLIFGERRTWSALALSSSTCLAACSGSSIGIGMGLGLLFQRIICDWIHHDLPVRRNGLAWSCLQIVLWTIVVLIVWFTMEPAAHDKRGQSFLWLRRSVFLGLAVVELIGSGLVGEFALDEESSPSPLVKLWRFGWSSITLSRVVVLAKSIHTW